MEKEDQIKNLIQRGVVDIIVKKEFEEKIKSGKKLIVKLGIDPSGADLHIGHMVVVRKLKEFQDLGHEIKLLFGNFTGQIGDPTGKMEARKPKTQAELEKNAEKYIEQAGVVLDTDKIDVVWNADWLSPLSFADVVKLASNFTVAQMLERDMFQDRIKKDMPISVHEFMYPLMQGYDSVALKADVELGGTDQTFNLLAGRTLQKAYGQEPQSVLTVPILEGLDGKIKMGKSEGNYIAVKDSPKDMFGKVMSIPDDLILKYYELAAFKAVDELSDLKAKMDEGENPKNLKMQLGEEVVKIYHSEDEAKKAKEEFVNIFQKGGLPDDIESKVFPDKTMGLLDLVSDSGLSPSRNEARRLIQAGAVKIDQKVVDKVDSKIELEKEILLQVGKRKFLKVKAQ